MTKILFVDDENQNVQIMKEILSFYPKYRMEIATSGEEALEIAKNYIPDIVLLDIMMPGVDGFEVCRKLRLKTFLNRTKIIMVSGLAMIGDRLKSYEYGADDYITKPFVEDELIAKLDVFSKLNRMEDFYSSSIHSTEKKSDEIMEHLEKVMKYSWSIKRNENLSLPSLQDIEGIQSSCIAIKDLLQVLK
jgi:DNA-binding response OmpR family regulator